MPNYATVKATPKVIFGRKHSGNKEPGVFAYPSWVITDADNNILVVDPNNWRVQMFTPKGKFIRHFVEGFMPCGIAQDGSGNIYVGDSFNRKIKKYSADGTFILEFGQLDRSRSRDNPGEFAANSGMAVDQRQGRLIVVDRDKHKVSAFELDGKFIQEIGWTGGAQEGQFYRPNAVTVTPSGEVVVADAGNNRIQVFNGEDLSFIRAFGTQGEGPGQFNNPIGVTSDPAGNIIIAEQDNSRVQVCTITGEFIAYIGKKGDGPGGLWRPYGVRVNSDGNIIVVDSHHHKVQVW